MKKIKLFYDRDCPFCKEYSNYVELRKEYDIQLINARDSIEEIIDFRKDGFDINNGMIVEYENKIYQGADAIKLINEFISKKKKADRLLSWFVKTAIFKSYVYPIILKIRKILLKAMSRDPKIRY